MDSLTRTLACRQRYVAEWTARTRQKRRAKGEIEQKYSEGAGKERENAKSLLASARMHRIGRSAYSAGWRSYATRRTVPVDEYCIPLTAPYSIEDYIPPPAPLSRPVLLKLHRLSALNPPTTEAGWKSLESLGSLVSIIEGVRLVDTSAVHAEQGQLVDGRVRAPAVELSGRASKPLESVGGRELLELAQIRKGPYYVARTPEGIRGKKSSSTKGSGEEN